MNRSWNRMSPLVLLVASLLFVPALHAQPSKKGSGDFFPKNFAENPLDTKSPHGKEGASSGLGNLRGGPSRDAEGQENGNSGEGDEESGEGNLFGNPGADAKAAKELRELKKLEKLQVGKENMSSRGKEDSPELFSKKLRVRSLGVIVNPLDKPHFEKVMEQLFALSASRDLDLSAIFAPQGFDKMNDILFQMKLMARGGVWVANPELPEPYKAVKTSPTWILETPEGDVLLEGFSSLENFVSPRGEYQDRSPEAWGKILGVSGAEPVGAKEPIPSE